MDIYVKIPLLEEQKFGKIKLGEEVVVHFTPISGRRAEKVNEMILTTKIGRINIRDINGYTN